MDHLLIFYPVLWGTGSQLKQIFPPNGILYGSVQNIFFFYKNNKEVLTAIDKIIGNSGGTTVVTIKIHLKNNLFLSREPSSNPLINTYPLDIIENKSSTKINAKASVCLIYKFSLLKSTVLINLPLEVSYPVLKTLAIHALFD